MCFKVKSLGYWEEDEKGDEERKHKHEPRPKVKCFRDIVCLVAWVLLVEDGRFEIPEG